MSTQPSHPIIREKIDPPVGPTAQIKPFEIRADPRREYVASSGLLWLTPFLRGLPHYVDDVTRDFGDDLYDRMLQDPQVASCMAVLKASILAGGVTIEATVAASHPAASHADFASPILPPGALVPPIRDTAAASSLRNESLRSEIADFCRRTLDNLARPLTDTLYEMLDGIAYGNKIAELIYTIPTCGPDAGRLMLAEIKVKPRRAVSFVVDTFNNVIGLLGLIPGQGYPVLLEGFIGAPPDTPNLLPREKFAVFSHAPANGDPRGTSLLRPAYNAWWMKQQIWSVYLKYLTQFAGPSLIGYTAPDAQAMPASDPFGNPLLDSLGNPTIVSPEQTMLNALQAFASGTAAVFPHGAQVTPVEMAGDGRAFLEAIDLFDRQIAKALLGQTLATEEGRHQSRAASQTHQEILDAITGRARQSLENMIARDLIDPLVRYNFGDSALALAPAVRVGEADPRDFAKDAQAIAQLAAAGFLGPDQYPGIDQMLGLPERSAAAAARPSEKLLSPEHETSLL